MAHHSLGKAVAGVEADGRSGAFGLGNLRVVMVKDGETWFAQGLEIDYSSEGSTIREAQDRFQDGLRVSMLENLRLYGNIKGVLRVAPPDVWKELVNSPKARFYLHHQVSIMSLDLPEEAQRELPYTDIQFFGEKQPIYAQGALA